MNRTFTIGLGMLVTGAAIGAAAVQTLHAQAKPPAFQIVEVTVNNEDGFKKEFLPVIGKVQQQVGGKFLARGGKTVGRSASTTYCCNSVRQYGTDASCI